MGNIQKCNKLLDSSNITLFLFIFGFIINLLCLLSSAEGEGV